MSALEVAAKDEDFPIGQGIDLRRSDVGRQHTGIASTAPVQFFLGVDVLIHCFEYNNANSRLL